MEVDVGTGREVLCGARVVPGAHELLGAPSLHALQLRFDYFFDRRHLVLSLLHPYFGKTRGAVHPFTGYLAESVPSQVQLFASNGGPPGGTWWLPPATRACSPPDGRVRAGRRRRG